MTGQHQKIINAAAKKILAPEGLFRVGSSRRWLYFFKGITYNGARHFKLFSSDKFTEIRLYFFNGVMYNDASEKSEFNFTGNCETPLQCECHCVHCIFQCGHALAPHTVYEIYNIRNSVWTKSQFRKHLI